MATALFKSALLQSIRLASGVLARSNTASDSADNRPLEDHEDDHEDVLDARSPQQSPPSGTQISAAADTHHVAVSVGGDDSLGSEATSGRSRLADVAKVGTTIVLDHGIASATCCNSATAHVSGRIDPRGIAQDVVLRIECYDRKGWSYGTLVRILVPSSLCLLPGAEHRAGPRCQDALQHACLSNELHQSTLVLCTFLVSTSVFCGRRSRGSQRWQLWSLQVPLQSRSCFKYRGCGHIISAFPSASCCNH